MGVRCAVMTESIERPTPDETVEASPAPARHDIDAAHDAVIAEAVGVIDHALGQMVTRELVSSGEVADLLLDLRSALTAAPSRV